MEDWAGFTDADLRKYKHQGLKNEGAQPRSQGTQGKRPQPSSLMAQRRPNQKRQTNRQTPPPVEGLTPDQMLSKPKAPKKKPEDKPTVMSSDASQTGTGNASPAAAMNTGSHGHSHDENTGKPQDEKSQNSDTKESAVDDETLITDDKEIFKHEAHTMESFQKQQKMIEEMNKKKKQMLHSAIKERAKAAKAESAKLTEIQQELNKLDQLLTVDVSIIRDKIETASREFFDAQKRYDRAEKEYVESKIQLHQKMECKEQLTEHLYTVIYQNEMRKSKKLAELMTKLEMEAGETPDISECEMPHPSLLSPVQLPVGRYGQIGLINTKSPPTSPEPSSEAPSLSAESEKSKEDSKADDKDTKSSDSDDKTTTIITNNETESGKNHTPDVSSPEGESIVKTDSENISKDINENSKESPQISKPET